MSTETSVSRSGAQTPASAFAQADQGQENQSQENHSVQGDPLSALWQTLTHSLALWIPCLVILLLALAGILLPQMPGQLNHEPASAARWLSGSAQGSLGELWRTLGLYNVLAHPILYIALAAAILVMSIRLAHHMAGSRAQSRWPQQAVEQQVPAPGIALELDRAGDLERRAVRVPAPPAAIHSQLRKDLAAAGIEQPLRAQIPYAQAARPEATREIRLAWAQNERFSLAPVLRDAGLLAALGAAWIMLIFGWHIGTPILAPGEGYYAAEHDLHIRYQRGSTVNERRGETTGRNDLQSSDQSERPSVLIHTVDGTTSLPVAEGRQLLAEYLVTTSRVAPGILLSVPGSDGFLQRLGQEDAVSQLGLVLTEAGSEETILLPELSAGLRIVRRAGDEVPWLVEYYGAGDVQPRARWDIEGRTVATLTLPESETTVLVEPASGLQVRIYHMPGKLFLLLGLSIAIMAGIGVLRKPFFALVQIGPWPGGSVLIIQTTDLSNPSVEALRDRILGAPVPADGTRPQVNGATREAQQ